MAALVGVSGKQVGHGFTQSLNRFWLNGGQVMEHENNPIANPLLVLREEFDDWAVLFDPDTGDAFGFNPVSVFIFKRLDGKHTLDDIMKELRVDCKNAPEDAEKYVRDFIEDLINRGMVGYEFQKG